MKVEDVIKKRRSIRLYRNQVLKDKDIEKIITAGIWAPSGLNNQPWRFKIVKGEDKDKLAGFTKYGDIIKSAKVLICVFLDHNVSYHREKDIMAIGACIQNMLLQAYDLGIGTCWLGEILNKRQEVQNYLATEPHLELMAVITFGYPKGRIPKASRNNLRSFIID